FRDERDWIRGIICELVGRLSFRRRLRERAVAIQAIRMATASEIVSRVLRALDWPFGFGRPRVLAHMKQLYCWLGHETVLRAFEPVVEEAIDGAIQVNERGRAEVDVAEFSSAIDRVWPRTDNEFLIGVPGGRHAGKVFHRRSLDIIVPARD